MAYDDMKPHEEAAVRIIDRLLKNADEDRKDWMATYRELLSYCRDGYSDRFYQDYMPDAFFEAQVSKTSEALDVYGAALYNQHPHRTVSPKGVHSPIAAERAAAMESYLNVTPKETNAHWHNRHSVNTAIVSGLGILRTAVDSKGLVCSKRIKPEDFFRDPDFDVPEEIGWMAVRRRSKRFQLITRYGWEKKRLKDVKAFTGTRTDKELIPTDARKNVEADDVGGEHGRQVSEQIDATHDLIEYYEIYFKHGLGHYRGSLKTAQRDEDDTASDDAVKLDDAPRKYIYVPDPESGNSRCKGFLIRDVERDEAGQPLKGKYKLAHEWEIPFYRDGQFPFEPLELLDDIDGHHPVSPLKPGLGWQRALNYLYTMLLGKARFTLRDVLVFVERQGIAFKKEDLDKIINGSDLEMLKVDAKDYSGPPVKPDEMVISLDFPEIKDTALKLIELCQEQHAKATGLYDILYTGETGRQMRSAAEVEMRDKNSRSRLSEMTARVEDWLSRVARKEAFAARYLFDPEDVEPVIGRQMAAKWGALRTEQEIEAFRQQELMKLVQERRQAQQMLAEKRQQAFMAAQQQGLPIDQAFQQMLADREQQTMSAYQPDAMRMRVQEAIDRYGINFGEWIFEHDIGIENGSARVKNRDFEIDSNDKLMQTTLPAVIDRLPEVAAAILEDTFALHGKDALAMKMRKIAERLEAQANQPVPPPDAAGGPPAAQPQPAAPPQEVSNA